MMLPQRTGFDNAGLHPQKLGTKRLKDRCAVLRLEDPRQRLTHKFVFQITGHSVPRLAVRRRHRRRSEALR